MSIFTGQRLPKEIFQIDIERMRRGWYSDAYFLNTVKILNALSDEGYTFQGETHLKDVDVSNLNNGDIIVEKQYFSRRKPLTLVAGVDEALAILEECTGYFNKQGEFINTFDQLEIEAVQDGTFAEYDGDPQNVRPVLKVRGRYRDFAILETPILGALTEASHIATNVYNVLVAAKGKDILFFPARFAHYKLQALHGYAYSLAVAAYNAKYGKSSRASVSTDDQGGWWGGQGGGTIAHASIASFLGDLTETMMQFAQVMPLDIPRIALIDFYNDCVGETLRVMKAMFNQYWQLYRTGQKEASLKYKLFGIRPDTSGNMRDKSITQIIGDKKLDLGVNPRLVQNLRRAMDEAWKAWELPFEAIQMAKQWCQEVKIVVTGGFNAEKIKWFEELGVPVDIYGVGSALLENSSATGTNTDYTADIVKVKIGDEWHQMSKAGRKPCDNPNLEMLSITTGTVSTTGATGR